MSDPGDGSQMNESASESWVIPEMGAMRYSQYPVTALKQVEKLLEQMDSHIKSWEKQDGFPPLLVVLPRKNPFIDIAASQKLFDRIPAPFKELYLFHEDRHGILSGKGSQRVYDAIWGFVHSLV
jgi:esterase/lipase